MPNLWKIYLGHISQFSYRQFSRITKKHTKKKYYTPIYLQNICLSHTGQNDFFYLNGLSSSASLWLLNIFQFPSLETDKLESVVNKIYFQNFGKYRLLLWSPFWKCLFNKIVRFVISHKRNQYLKIKNPLYSNLSK